MLSETAISALKTTFSMILALYLALLLGWDKPIWAVMTVFLISVGSVGASIQKGVRRVVGTLAGALLAILLSALFAQQVWAFALSMALLLYVLSYIASTSSAPYGYQTAAMVLLLIVTSAGMSQNITFMLIVARVQETLLGVVVFTLIDVFFWPRQQRDDFDQALQHFRDQLHSTLSVNYAAAAQGRGLLELPAEATSRGLMALLDQLTLLQQASRFELSARALPESTWQNFWAASNSLCLTLSQFRWHWDLLPAEDRANINLMERWHKLDSVLPTQEDGASAALVPQQKPAQALPEAEPSAFKQVAVLSIVQQDLDTIEQTVGRLTQSLQHLVQGEHEPGRAKARKRFAGFLQPHKLYVALLAPLVFLLSFIIWQHVRVPAGTLFIYLSSALGVSLVVMPGLPLNKVAMPLCLGIALAFLQYTLLLPWLDEFYQLVIVLFVNFFLLLWLFGRPQQALVRLALGVGGLLIFSPALELRPSFNALGGINIFVIICFSLVSVVWLYALFIPASTRQFKWQLADLFATLQWQALHAVGQTKTSPWLGLQRLWRDRSTLAQVAGLEKLVAMGVIPESRKAVFVPLIESLYVISFCLNNVRNNAGLITKACDEVPPLLLIMQRQLDVLMMLGEPRGQALSVAAGRLTQAQESLAQWWLSAGSVSPQVATASGLLHLLNEALQRYTALRKTALIH